MPTVYPVTLYTPEKLTGYPHMAKRDAAIWERFLAAHAAEYIAFSYDVALGGRTVDYPQATEAARLGWQYSTALKIDAVGWQGNQVWIIEVRPEATVGTYGSAVVYTLVARREALTTLPLIPAIVCESIQLDVEWACLTSGVQVVKV